MTTENINPLKAVGFHNPIIANDDSGVYAWYSAFVMESNDFANPADLDDKDAETLEEWKKACTLHQAAFDRKASLTLPIFLVPHLIARDGLKRLTDFNHPRRLTELTVARKLGQLQDVLILVSKDGQWAVQFPPVTERVLELYRPETFLEYHMGHLNYHSTQLKQYTSPTARLKHD